MATAFELGCSTLLVAGLATRLATLPLFEMLTVIQLFVYPSAWSEHLRWGSILAFLLTRGPGPHSLDRLIGLDAGPAPAERRQRRRPPRESPPRPASSQVAGGLEE